MEFNPIKVINPTQSWEVKKLDPRLDPLHLKSYHKKFRSFCQEISEIWAVIEFNPISFINPSKSRVRLKIRFLSIQKVIMQNFGSFV